MRKEQPGRDDLCPFCGSVLHACMNCRFYSPSVLRQCLAEKAARIEDKRVRNDCVQFIFREIQSQRQAPPAEQTKKKWDNLFPGLVWVVLLLNVAY